MTQGVAGNRKLRKSSWTTSTAAEEVSCVILAASFASTSTAVIALPQVGHRVSEGTASWSDLNDGAGGLFHKVDDGVDDLVVGEKILAMLVTAVSVCRHQVCSLDLKGSRA